MSLQRYLEVVATMIRKETNVSRRETLERYRHFIEKAIEESDGKLEVVG